MDASKKITPAPPATRSRRIRRLPEDARRQALEAARTLLLEQGPAAITLTAVAQALGVTHGNITYHFGTVAALQEALVATMARELGESIYALVLEMREGRVTAERIVETAFRSFDEEGAGRLIAWLVSTHQTHLLQPLFDSVRGDVQRLREGEPPGIDETRHGAAITTLMLLTSALGGALIGGPLHEAVGMDPSTLKRLIAMQLKALRVTPIR